MKILNVNMTLDPVGGGGTAERTFQMSRFLAKADVECTILTTDLGITPQRLQGLNGVKVIAQPCLFKRFYVPKISYGLLKNSVKDADIVHLMGHWTLINALVYLTIRHIGKPYVVCPAGSLPIWGRSKLLKRFYNWVIGKRLIQNANGYIAISSDEISHFQAYGIDPSRITHIPNGIDFESFLANDNEGFRNKYGLNHHPFILFVGRLNPIKGPDLLLQAFCQVKNDFPMHHLVFAGPDGGMLTELKEIVTKNNVEDRVHFIDYLGGLDKSHAYHASELLAIPSRQEAMSIVVLEAGVTGTPVLITDQCGFNEIAAIGGGYVVPASIKGLQEGLREALGNPLKSKTMGINLKKFTDENFLWDSIVNKYLTLYSQILSPPLGRVIVKE